MNFIEKYLKAAQKNNSLVCIGLDSDLNKIPKLLSKSRDTLFEFNKKIIDATVDLVCAYKPNMAFYEVGGSAGITSLKKTIQYIPNHIPVILDAKRGDIGNTNKMYAKEIFEYFGTDATTVSPYLGEDSIAPFAEYQDKLTFVLCLTSNPGAKDFQLLEVEEKPSINKEGKPLYKVVAQKVKDWNKNNNLGLVVGATFPEQLKEIREMVEDMPILIPGVGAQGGDLEKVVQYGTDKNGKMAIINSSREIIFASAEKDFDQKAREKALLLRDNINQALKQK
ncbi:MAG: Orotidine 5'-phosphate decarboxylase [candidate division Zixibacteria bacterium RBG-1]|nr:MAG: Orotidine 5'-phosphate decarboxylase [candidate division Zixibacteria bacterium RBG-1]OGC83932.1 MAG: orotidine 5'-phosphate decarboxylase [candidate division Zixibacteria bacterium RBG_19FT_COMBO_42_43]